MDPAVYKAFGHAFVSEWNRQVAVKLAKGADTRNELANIDGQIERLVDANADGGVTGASVRGRLETLEKRKLDLMAAVSDPQSFPPRLHLDLAAV